LGEGRGEGAWKCPCFVGREGLGKASAAFKECRESLNR
jgi:hypothetical protein